MSMSKLLHKITHWEYWNTWVIYLPLAPFWIYHTIANRKIFFFERANPTFLFGGMAMELKSHIYDLIPDKFIPKTLLIKNDIHKMESVAKFLESNNAEYEFPLIAKPDVGLKGLGVSVIKCKLELLKYAQEADYDFLIQEKIPYQNEIGVFYCRYPNQKHGFITGTTKKNFLKVIGDGQLTVRELLQKNKRAAFQLHSLEKIVPDTLNSKPEKGKEVTIIPIGSHTRGAEFKDISAKISKDFAAKIDALALAIPGFYYGRFDILYKDENTLLDGTNFKVIELNGAQSESIHMYDPNHSLFFAWREILKHWSIMSKIAIQNKSTFKNPVPFGKGIKMIYDNLQLEKKFKKQLYG